VLTGYGEQSRAEVPPGTFIARDVGRACDWILGNEPK
jgi:hypothetical protein